MTRSTVDALGLIRSLEPLARRAQGSAALVFDADGTLWTGDVGIDTFTDALEKRLLRDEARAALIAEIFEHGLAADLELEGRDPDDVDVNLLGQQLQRAFELGRYPEQAATEMQVWAYAGWSEQELREHARESLNARQHITQVFGPLLPVVIWARDAGLRTVIVSASPQIVVEEAARTLGFAPQDITAGRAKSGPGGFLPELASPLPYGPGKVRAGRLLLGTTEWLAAFGDSGFDAEMLSQAKLAVAVRPRAELLERLDAIPDAVLFDGSPL